jgi:hypothetical protein
MTMNSSTAMSHGLERFRAAVLEDSSLQERLSKPDDMDVFAALAIDCAHARGIDLAEEEVKAAVRPDPLGLARFGDAAAMETGLPPSGWLPVHASWQGGQFFVQWGYFGAKQLVEPFFEESLRVAGRKPFSRLFRFSTPIGRSAQWLEVHGGLQPSGFIFHMSRCGSTLVSQMLAALPQNVVVSEASPIDAVLQARFMNPGLTQDEWTRWLRWMVEAFGQKRAGERHFFIKLDSWHTLALPLFRAAFPSVPWVFLYRDPIEVMVSQIGQRGLQTVPGGLIGDPFGLGLDPDASESEEYCALVLRKTCEAVVQCYPQGGGLLVNYSQLPEALWTKILPHFGVTFGGVDRATMIQASQFDAKSRDRTFASDSDAKKRAATDLARKAAAEHLDDIYVRLEAIRLGG